MSGLLVKFATGATAVMAAGSVLIESNQVAVNKAGDAAAAALTDSYISDTIGASKLQYQSEKHNTSKKFLKNARLFDGFTKIYNGLGGYFAGFFGTAARNIPTLAFSAYTLLVHNPKAKIAGAIGAFGSMLIDFILNGTNLFEKTDYLEK